MSDYIESRLLFVFGAARSGTTFLAKLLDASPDVLYRHEPDISSPTTSFPFLPACASYAEFASRAAEYALHLAVLRTPRTVSSPPYFAKRFRSAVGNYLWCANAYLAKGGERLRIRIPVFDWTKPAAQPVVVVKSVSSLVRAPLFHQALPAARFIHLVRHPCAVVSSRKRGLAGGHLNKPPYVEEALAMDEAKGYPLSADTVRGLGDAGQVAYVWMVHNDKVYSELKDDPRYRFVSYEALCLDLTDHVHALYEFAGLDWQDQTEAFIHAVEETSATQSSFFGIVRNVRSGLYKWRHDLTAAEIEEVEWVVGHSLLGQRFLDDARAVATVTAN